MNYRFAPRALREAERKKKWWRANRLDALDLFDEELAAAIEQIRRGAPSVGAIYRSSFGRTVRKVLMPTEEPRLLHGQGRRDRHPLGVGRSPRARPEAVVVVYRRTRMQ
jgi:hypothetical protein